MELGAGNTAAAPEDLAEGARPIVELPLLIPALADPYEAGAVDGPAGRAPAGRTAPNGVSSSIWCEDSLRLGG